MCDEHGLAAQIVGGGTYILDVVGDGTGVKSLCGGAGAVPAQAQCDRAIAGIGKEVQEVFPARCGMPTAVDEKQRHRMRFAAGPLIDHLEHELIIRQAIPVQPNEHETSVALATARSDARPPQPAAYAARIVARLGWAACLNRCPTG
jgi:hypothetical protein